MDTAVTKGIKISVKKSFLAEQSNPSKNKYLHSYHVFIENLSDHKVQLMSRHWYIIDSLGQNKEVKGEGVVGEQPILHSRDQYSYTSWCPLPSDIGIMFGNFNMINLDTNEKFEVRIPEFILTPAYKLN